MTTIVWMKDKYIAADKRWVWAEKWWADNQTKIFSLIGDNYNVYLMTSWLTQMPEKMHQLLDLYFKESFDPTKIYDLQEDLKKTNQWWNFGCLLVYNSFEWEEDSNKKTRTKSSSRCWKVWQQTLEEADIFYAAYWSWSDFLDGIMAVKPDMSPEDLFKLVAIKDIYTSPTFDLINLSI